MAESPLDSSAGRPRPMARPFAGAKVPPRPPVVGYPVGAPGSPPYIRHRSATPVIGTAAVVDMTPSAPDGDQARDVADFEPETVTQQESRATFAIQTSIGELETAATEAWDGDHADKIPAANADLHAETVIDLPRESDVNETPEALVSRFGDDPPIHVYETESEAPCEAAVESARLDQDQAQQGGLPADEAGVESVQDEGFDNLATMQPVAMLSAFMEQRDPDLARLRIAETIERLATRIRNGEIPLGHSANVGSETAVLASLLATLLSEAL